MRLILQRKVDQSELEQDSLRQVLMYTQRLKLFMELSEIAIAQNVKFDFIETDDLEINHIQPKVQAFITQIDFIGVINQSFYEVDISELEDRSKEELYTQILNAVKTNCAIEVLLNYDRFLKVLPTENISFTALAEILPPGLNFVSRNKDSLWASAYQLVPKYLKNETTRNQCYDTVVRQLHAKNSATKAYEMMRYAIEQRL